MLLEEKSISYYLKWLSENPTSELDAPTITLLMQGFRGYLLSSVNELTDYIHTHTGVGITDVTVDTEQVQTGTQVTLTFTLSDGNTITASPFILPKTSKTLTSVTTTVVTEGNDQIVTQKYRFDDGTQFNGTPFTISGTGGGGDGRGIVSINKTATSGLVDTYTITYTDNTTSTFTVTNGADGTDGTNGVGITSITKTATAGLVDTYTVTLSNGNEETFTVTNGADGADGRGIVSITKTSTVGLVDTYTITYTDNTTSTFTVTNGSGGSGTVGVELTPSSLSSAVQDALDEYLANGTNLILKLSERDYDMYVNSFIYVEAGVGSQVDTYIRWETTNNYHYFTLTNGSWVYSTASKPSSGSTQVLDITSFDENDATTMATIASAIDLLDTTEPIFLKTGSRYNCVPANVGVSTSGTRTTYTIYYVQGIQITSMSIQHNSNGDIYTGYKLIYEINGVQLSNLLYGLSDIDTTGTITRTATINQINNLWQTNYKYTTSITRLFISNLSINNVSITDLTTVMPTVSTALDTINDVEYHYLYIDFPLFHNNTYYHVRCSFTIDLANNTVSYTGTATAL